MGGQQTLRVACLTLAVSLVPCSIAQGADDAKAALQRRREQLAKVVTRGDEILAARAGRELVILGESNGFVCQSLVEAVRTRFREPEHFGRLSTQFYVAALAELGEPAIPAILEALKSEGATESSSLVLLASLGQMGAKAKAAIPELKRRLEDPKASATLKDCLRLVAANAGDRDLQVELRKDLEKLLLTESPRVGDEAERDRRWRWLQLIHWMRLGDWAADILAEHLRREFKSYAESRSHPRGDESGWWLQVSVQAVNYANSAAKFSDELEAAQRRALKDDRMEAISFSFALARVDAKKRAAALRRLCGQWPKDKALNWMAWLILSQYFAPPLVNGNVSSELLKLLDDGDLEIARHAADALECAGLAARDAAPSLLELLASTKDAKRRVLVAEALDAVCDITRLAQLETAFQKETDAAVRARLSKAIDRVRTCYGQIEP
jgi:hypothetical protein